MKAKAVLEVVVVFSLTLALVALVALSPIGEWERQVSNYFFIEYTVMIAVPLLILLITRRDLAAYGLNFHNLRYHLNITATAIVPVALSYIPIAYYGYTTRNAALIMAVTKIALLFVVAWLLRRKPTMNESGILAGALLLVGFSTLNQQSSVVNAISAIVFYIFFLGFGEELLFRGYIQSRLNIAWGRPFRFYGVNWGWGVIITSVLFGLMHVINIASLTKGAWQPELWWGFWTFFAGLVSGYVREKTGSIVATTILHGLPQALYSAFPVI